MEAAAGQLGPLSLLTLLMRISTIHGRRHALAVTLTAALVAGACAAPLKLAHDDAGSADRRADPSAAGL